MNSYEFFVFCSATCDAYRTVSHSAVNYSIGSIASDRDELAYFYTRSVTKFLSGLVSFSLSLEDEDQVGIVPIRERTIIGISTIVSATLLYLLVLADIDHAPGFFNGIVDGTIQCAICKLSSYLA